MCNLLKYNPEGKNGLCQDLLIALSQNISLEDYLVTLFQPAAQLLFKQQLAVISLQLSNRTQFLSLSTRVLEMTSS
jgi:hypothetical protein